MTEYKVTIDLVIEADSPEGAMEMASYVATESSEVKFWNIVEVGTN